MTTLVLVLATCFVCACARMAYVLPDGVEDLLSRAIDDTSFSCEGRSYGYYADIVHDCQMFHVCNPILDDEGAVDQMAHFSFVCGNQTVFSQDALTCMHPEDAMPCEDSETFFEVSNAEFGIIPEKAQRRK